MEINRFLRMLSQAVVVAAAALLQINTAQAAACTPPPEMCANAPAAEAEHCQTLASYLAEFQQEVCSLEVADPSYTPSYSSAALRASGNLGPALLANWSLPRIEQEIDSLAALGAKVVQIEVVYPLLTPSFHDFMASQDRSYTTTADDYLTFFRNVVNMVRARGMQVHIEHSMLLPAYSTLNTTPYYASMKTTGKEAVRTRYHQERADEALLILTELEPDYLTLLTEPDTNNRVFGLVDGGLLNTPQDWQSYVEYAISRFPAHTTQLGAGVGTWDTDEYIRMFAGMPALDYVDMHVYPARGPYRNYLSTLLSWSDLVRSIDPSKKITIGESWLYKVDAAEIVSPTVSDLEVFARDVYSYWEPLDITFMRLLDQAARAKQIEFVTPFWSRYFFAYLDYAETSTLSPIERMYLATTTAFQQMQEGSLTGTGRAFKELAMATNPLVIGSLQPNHGPQTGPAAAQTVILNGANFSMDSAPAVLFGDAAATSVEVLDASTLRMVVPAGSGSVTVTVSSPDGRRVSKPNAYTYDPPPTLIGAGPAQGSEAGGTLVTIKGQNFMPQTAGTRVLFGGKEASQVTVIDASTILAVSPAGIGTIPVTVINPDSQVAELANAFSYVRPLWVQGAIPSEGRLIGGNEVWIMGTGFGEGTQVFFGSKQAAVQSSNTNVLKVIAPAGMGSATIRVVNPDGQVAQSQQRYTYTSNPAPIVLYASHSQIPENGGIKVYLYGQNFKPGAKVYFGSAPGHYVFVLSSAWIQVIAPAGQGEVPIRVVNPDGKLAVSLQPISYSSAHLSTETLPSDVLGIGAELQLPKQIFLPALSR